MKKYIGLVLSVLILGACSSGSKKSGKDKLGKNKNVNLSFKGLELVPEVKFKNKMNCKLKKETWSEKDWKYFVDLGNSCLHSAKYPDLLKVANYISINYPDLPWGPFFKSHYFTHKKLHLKSLWLIDLSIEKSPNLGLLHYQKAILLHKLKYIGAAKSSALRAVQINPKNFGAQTYLAQLYLQANEIKPALKHALLAEKILNKNNDIYKLLSDIYFAKKDFPNAISYLGKVKMTKALANDIYFKLAYSYENLQDQPKSVNFYKKIEARKKANLLKLYGLDVNEKIKEMEVEIAKLEAKKRQPSNAEEKKVPVSKNTPVTTKKESKK